MKLVTFLSLVLAVSPAVIAQNATTQQCIFEVTDHPSGAYDCMAGDDQCYTFTSADGMVIAGCSQDDLLQNLWATYQRNFLLELDALEAHHPGDDPICYDVTLANKAYTLCMQHTQLPDPKCHADENGNVISCGAANETACYWIVNKETNAIQGGCSKDAAYRDMVEANYMKTAVEELNMMADGTCTLNNNFFIGPTEMFQARLCKCNGTDNCNGEIQDILSCQTSYAGTNATASETCQTSMAKCYYYKVDDPEETLLGCSDNKVLETAWKALLIDGGDNATVFSELEKLGDNLCDNSDIKASQNSTVVAKICSCNEKDCNDGSQDMKDDESAAPARFFTLALLPLGLACTALFK